MTDSEDRLASIRSVLLGPSPGESLRFEIEQVTVQHRNILVKLLGVDDRSSAEKLVGGYLFIEEDEVVEPKKGSYFVHDIIGCTVIDTEGSTIGRIEDVYKLPGHDLWVVRSGDRLHMIPAVKEFVKGVDLGRRRIVVRIIEGLFDLA